MQSITLKSARPAFLVGRRVKGVAYTGDVLNHWEGPLVIDLATMEARAPMALLVAKRSVYGHLKVAEPLEASQLELERARVSQQDVCNRLQSAIVQERPEIVPPFKPHDLDIAREIRTALRGMEDDERMAFALQRAQADDFTFLQALAGVPEWLIPGFSPAAVFAAHDESQFAPKRRALQAKLEVAEARLAIVEEVQAKLSGRIAELEREASHSPSLDTTAVAAPAVANAPESMT